MPTTRIKCVNAVGLYGRQIQGGARVRGNLPSSRKPRPASPCKRAFPRKGATRLLGRSDVRNRRSALCDGTHSDRTVRGSHENGGKAERHFVPIEDASKANLDTAALFELYVPVDAFRGRGKTKVRTDVADRWFL